MLQGPLGPIKNLITGKPFRAKDFDAPKPQTQTPPRSAERSMALPAETLAAETLAANGRTANALLKTSDHSAIKPHVTQTWNNGGAQGRAEVLNLAQQIKDRDPAIGAKFESDMGVNLHTVDAKSPPSLNALNDKIHARHQNDLHTHFESASGMPQVPLSTKLKADAVELGGKIMGKNQASRALEHYREGSGEDLQMPAEWLRGNEHITQAEEENHTNIGKRLHTDPTMSKQLSSLKDDQSITILIDETNKNIHPTDGSDLQYTSGKSNLRTSGELKVTRKGNTLHVEGQPNYHWSDDYDWHKNTQFFKGMVSGKEMMSLETLGKAKRFKMFGDWSGMVSGAIPLKPDGSLGAFKLDWQPRHVSPGS